MKNGRRLPTKYWVVHTSVDNSVDKLIHNPHIEEAAQLLKKGELIAFPTETVYGLGANALSNKAVQKIYEAKGRPSDNPLIVHVASGQQLEQIVDKITEHGRLLINSFWPGPLTLVFKSKNNISTQVTAGLETVAVRMPSHPIALALILASGLPIAAPSANRSGKPSPTRAQHVGDDLEGRIAGILDGGATGVGIESTVVDVTGSQPIILRPGGITKEELEKVVGQVLVDPALPESVSSAEITRLDSKSHLRGIEAKQPAVDKLEVAPRSPGVKYTHYAPDALMYLASLEQGIEKMRQIIKKEAASKRELGYRVAILTTEEGLREYEEAELILSLGYREDLSSISQALYHCLRKCDQVEVDYVYAESFPVEGLGEAIMNRMLKAAAGRVIT